MGIACVFFMTGISELVGIRLCFSACRMALSKIQVMCGKDGLRDFLCCCMCDARLGYLLLIVILCIVFIKFCVFRSLIKSSMSDSHCDQFCYST